MKTYTTPTGHVLSQVEAEDITSKWLQGARWGIFEREATILSSTFGDLDDVRKSYEKICDRLLETGTTNTFPYDTFEWDSSPSFQKVLGAVNNPDIDTLASLLKGHDLTDDEMMGIWEAAVRKDFVNPDVVLPTAKMYEFVVEFAKNLIFERSKRPNLVSTDLYDQIDNIHERVCARTADEIFQRWQNRQGSWQISSAVD